MAIVDARKKKIGRELKEWVYLGVRAGMLRSASQYETQKIANLPAAIQQIKRAVDMPHRARTRVNYFIQRYDAANGAGSAQALIVESLSLAGTVTLQEINSELTSLENYAQGLVDHVNNDGWSWDQVSADIQANVENEAWQWTFEIPPDYIDVWGE